jgi:hypothetical protein
MQNYNYHEGYTVKCDHWQLINTMPAMEVKKNHLFNLTNPNSLLLSGAKIKTEKIFLHSLKCIKQNYGNQLCPARLTRSIS